MPEGLEQQVRDLPIEALQELGEALFDFRSLTPTDKRGWTASIIPPLGPILEKN